MTGFSIIIGILCLSDAERPDQILDKTVLGYGAIFGLIEDTHLSGNQYSLIGSIGPIAQLAWQPFSMILIVKVPHRVLMPTLVLGWGLAQAAMGVCNNFGGLLATRFFLGLFEAGCLPLFSVITSQWYRRAEQPIRVAAWYGTNGIATIVASALSYGLGHIPTKTMQSWRMCVFTLIITRFPTDIFSEYLSLSDWSRLSQPHSFIGNWIMISLQLVFSRNMSANKPSSASVPIRQGLGQQSSGGHTSLKRFLN